MPLTLQQQFLEIEKIQREIREEEEEVCRNSKKWNNKLANVWPLR